jgi:hypothetical protein
MTTINRDEVLAHAEGVSKLIRARKHLVNRGAERACIRLLENVIKKAERDLFKPDGASLLTGNLPSHSRQRSGRSAEVTSKRKTSHRPRAVNG